MSLAVEGDDVFVLPATIVSFRNSVFPRDRRPPLHLSALALLPLTVQAFRLTTATVLLLNSPPPRWAAWLPARVQLIRSAWLWLSLKRPPPSWAMLPLSVLAERVRVWALNNPPPLTFASLLLKRQLTTLAVPPAAL